MMDAFDYITSWWVAWDRINQNNSQVSSGVFVNVYMATIVAQHSFFDVKRTEVARQPQKNQFQKEPPMFHLVV